MRLCAVAWVSFFLFNIKPLQCTCVPANLLATGLEYVLALVFLSNILPARNGCGDYTRICYIISITWMIKLVGYRSWGIRNFNLRTKSSQEEGKDCFEPFINIYRPPQPPHRHLPQYFCSPRFNPVAKKEKLFMCRKNNTGGPLPPLFSSTKLRLLNAACIHTVLQEYVNTDFSNNVTMS
jgi:hypothetical protein